jgi:hypothetical protein
MHTHTHAGQVLAANHALLDIIHEGDYDGYARLTSEDVTCFDLSETGGNLVEGQVSRPYVHCH